jgi:spore coat assembly protein
MKIKKGDLVTRKSYDHDTIFKVTNIKNNVYYLKGLDVRLYADSDLKDLVKYVEETIEEDFLVKIKDELILDRSDFFYMPAKILHLDGDNDYLSRCLKFYKDAGVFAVGKKVHEIDIASNIKSYIDEVKPDIIIITGHDAYYRKKGDVENIKNYKNTENFVRAVREARKLEKSHDKLIIIAGACQSYYEELIKAGANYASSPKRVNIHALDPAIIAVSISLTERNKEIDLFNLLEKTKYGSEGMGGIMGNGLMYVGYPRG